MRANDNILWKFKFTPFLLNVPLTEQQTSPECWRNWYTEHWAVAKNWTKERYTVSKLVGHTGWVLAIEVCQDLVVSGSDDHTIKIWDVHHEQCRETLSGHQGPVNTLMFDEHKIISGSDDKTLKYWDLHTGQCL